MKVLLWKEWRENSGLFMAFLLLSFCGMAVLASVNHTELMGTLQQVFCAFFASLLGANLIAGEVGANTFQFLSTQPIRRRQIWMAKVGLGAISIACLMLITLLSIYLIIELCAPDALRAVFPETVRARDVAPRVTPLLAGNILFWATLVLLFYSASLFASGIFGSAITAAIIGTLGTIVIRFFALELLSAIAEGVEALVLGSAVIFGLDTFGVVIAAFGYVGSTVLGASISNIALAFLFLFSSLFSFTTLNSMQKAKMARAVVSLALLTVCGVVASLTVVLWYLHLTSLSPREVTSISAFVPSSDGKRIAFMPRGSKVGVSRIWVIDYDGKNLKEVGGRPYRIFFGRWPFTRSQVWSSDGESLIFVSSTEPFGPLKSTYYSRLMFANVEDCSSKMILPKYHYAHLYIQWLPDEKAFMYYCQFWGDETGTAAVRIGSVSQDGRHLTQTTFENAGSYVSVPLLNHPLTRRAMLARMVSRTASTYSAKAQYELIKIDLLTGDRNSVELPQGVVPLAASADGEVVALQKVVGDSKAEVWLRHLENGEERFVTERDELDPRRFAVRFSPDSSWAHCFTKTSLVGLGDGTKHRLFDARTGAKRELPEGVREVSFSPDSRWVVYSAPSGDEKLDKDDAWAMNLETGDTVTVIEHSYFAPFAWSPDGKRVACRVYRHDRNSIWIIDPEAKEATTIWRANADISPIIWGVTWLTNDKVAFIKDVRASSRIGSKRGVYAKVVIWMKLLLGVKPQPEMKVTIWTINADGSGERQIFPLEQ